MNPRPGSVSEMADPSTHTSVESPTDAVRAESPAFDRWKVNSAALVLMSVKWNDKVTLDDGFGFIHGQQRRMTPV
jgi:hypothetical protein